MRFTTVLLYCALSFAAPFAMGDEGLIEDHVWQAAQSSGSALPIKSFVMHFPESRFVEEAEQRLAEFQIAERSGHGSIGHRYVQ